MALLKRGDSESTGSNSTTKAVQAISQIVFETAVQMHITHLQAVQKSYEIHKALDVFYVVLAELNDELVEKSVSVTGLLMNYSNMSIVNNLEPVGYIKQKMGEIELHRKSIAEPYIQALVDDVIQEYGHALYRLENLK